MWLIELKEQRQMHLASGLRLVWVWGFFPRFPILEQFGWDSFSFLSAEKLVERRGLLLRKCSLKTFSPFSSLMTASGLCATFSLPVPQFPHVHKGKVEQRKAGLHQGGLGSVWEPLLA